MATSEQGFVDRLIGEEIRRMVADAAQGGMISTQQCAEQILRTYSGCSLSETEIANRLVMAAASAGIAVEIGQAAARANPVAGAENG
jgi:hypothetical protein